MSYKSKKKKTLPGKPQAEEKVVVSPPRVQGVEKASAPEGKQNADSTVLKATTASVDKALFAKNPEDELRTSHKFIKERVVDGDPPEEILDISKPFKDSHEAGAGPPLPEQP
jgi:hypothetical protein